MSIVVIEKEKATQGYVLYSNNEDKAQAFEVAKEKQYKALSTDDYMRKLVGIFSIECLEEIQHEYS